MSRGDVVVTAASGDFGKPRPAVVVQRNGLDDLGTIFLCPFTTDLEEHRTLRPLVEPDGGNGLRSLYAAMADKTFPQPRRKIARIIGRISPADLARIDAALRIVFDLA